MRVSLRIANPEHPEKVVEIPNALIDTGATWTCIPRRLVADLGLRDAGPFNVRTAAGPQQLRQSYAQLEFSGKNLVTNILLSDTLDIPLIGVTTLESLGLSVDPTKEQLIETEVFLL